MHNPRIQANRIQESRKAQKRARKASVKLARKLRAANLKMVAFTATEGN